MAANRRGRRTPRGPLALPPPDGDERLRLPDDAEWEAMAARRAPLDGSGLVAGTLWDVIGALAETGRAVDDLHGRLLAHGAVPGGALVQSLWDRMVVMEEQARRIVGLKREDTDFVARTLVGIRIRLETLGDVVRRANA